MELEFAGEVVEWRGPAPYHFVPLPPHEAEMVDEVKAEVAYWGVVPVTARLGETSFTTSMFPREGTWFLPLKDAVRRAEGVGLGDDDGAVAADRSGSSSWLSAQAAPPPAHQRRSIAEFIVSLAASRRETP